MAERKQTKSKNSGKNGAPKKNVPKKNAPKKAARKPLGTGVYIMCFVIVSVLLTVSVYMDGGIVTGLVGALFDGLFGLGALAVPIAAVGLTFYLIIKNDLRKTFIKTALSMGIIVDLSAFIHLVSADSIPVRLAYGAGVDGEGGGILGSAVGLGLEVLFNKIAAAVLLIAVFIALVTLLCERNLIHIAWTYLRGMFGALRDEYDNVKTYDARDKGYNAGKKQVEKYQQRAEERRRKNPDILNAANSFAIDAKNDNIASEDPFAELDARRKRKEESPQTEQINGYEVDTSTGEILDAPEPPAEENGEFDSNGIDEIFSSMEPPAEPETEDEPLIQPMPSFAPKTQNEPHIPKAHKEPAHHAPISAEPVSLKKEKISDEENRAFHDEIYSAFEQPQIEYVKPSTDILDPIKHESEDLRREMRETAEKLIRILEDFNVKAKLLQVTQGPTVTRYEILPSSGIKLSKISGLADDIALNLAVPNVLVAPVPGKAAVGIEIPNNKIGTVSIREILEAPAFRDKESKLTVAFGKDIGGRVVVGDIAKMPHVLIAGATGSGKSVCINTIITSILYKASPNDVKMIMVDPKVVELGVYNGIPHLLVPVVTEPKKAAGALNWAVTEMMRRYDLFAETKVRNIEGYNNMAERTGQDKMPSIVIIIDELADLMMVAAKEVEDYICRLTQLARAAGIHLIIATQRPSVDVITGLIKANVPSRIAFAVSSVVDSRVILDRGGAEKLLGRGDMLYYPAGQRTPMRVQGAFVSDDEIARVIDFIKETSEETHYSEDLEEHIERCSSGENGVTPDAEDDGDELLPDAIQLAVELGQISTAMIQRRLSVGYSRAGRIIDQMEARGIISGPNGSKPRQVYMSHADLGGGSGGQGTI